MQKLTTMQILPTAHVQAPKHNKLAGTPPLATALSAEGKPSVLHVLFKWTRHSDKRPALDTVQEQTAASQTTFEITT